MQCRGTAFTAMPPIHRDIRSHSFLLVLWLWHCIRAPSRRGRYWEIHPRRPISRDPRDFPRAKPEGNLEGRGKSWEIYRGRGFCTPRPEGFPEGEARGKSRGSRGAKPTAKENLEGGGDGFPNTSRVLVEHGHSLIITREGLLHCSNVALWW